MCRGSQTRKKVSFCASFEGQKGKEDDTDEGWQKSKSRIRIQKTREINETEVKNMFEVIQEEEDGHTEVKGGRSKKKKAKEEKKTIISWAEDEPPQMVDSSDEEEAEENAEGETEDEKECSA
eukprot:1829158-Karenia_brevis.AAC.1